MSFLFRQGDRFGGALDAAARQFSNALDNNMEPMEFVNDMRKKGQLIMGIGHRVKSVRFFPFPFLLCKSKTLYSKNDIYLKEKKKKKEKKDIREEDRKRQKKVKKKKKDKREEDRRKK